MARKKNEPNKNALPDFDTFWDAYPLHKGKQEAMAAWRRLSADDKAKALAVLPRYRDDCLRQGISFKYAQGWLNKRRFCDYDDTGNAAPSAPSTSPTSACAKRPDTPSLFGKDNIGQAVMEEW